MTRSLLPLIPNAAREAQLLLMHHLRCDELYLLTNQDVFIKEDAWLKQALRRRMENEPFEYITNRVDFYGEEFYIDKGALIPRPETELLVDAVLKELPSDFNGMICEVGVGSGIVSIMLAKHLPHARFIAVDISKEALKVAATNIKRHNLQDRIELRKSDMLERVDEKIDYLVSNPPYIQNGTKLQTNLAYEPKNALFGGDKGDEMIQELIRLTLSRNIKYFSCEIGYDQKNTVQTYLDSYPYKKLAFYKDYGGFDRGFTLKAL